MKKLIQYLIYPTFFTLNLFTILYVLQNDLNHYIYFPILLVFSALMISFLERILPYEVEFNTPKNDRLLDGTHFTINSLVKQSGAFTVALLSPYLIIGEGFWNMSFSFELQFVIALALFDFVLFFVHKLSHEIPFLWKFHAIHHSSRRLYWLNGEKRHPIHAMFEGLPALFIMMFLGIPEVVILAVLSFLGVNMFLQHANIDYKTGFLKYIFSNAEVHRFHHRTSEKESQVNYSAVFLLWDHLFGSFYYKNDHVSEVGIRGEEDFTSEYIKQFVYPFEQKETIFYK